MTLENSRINPPRAWPRGEGNDLELRKELDKINWKKHIQYGNIRVQVRDGKKTLTTIERTYPD